MVGIVEQIDGEKYMNKYMNNDVKHWTEYTFPGRKYVQAITPKMFTEEGEIILRSRKHHGTTGVSYDRSYALNKLAAETFARDRSMNLNDWIELLKESYEHFQGNGGILE